MMRSRRFPLALAVLLLAAGSSQPAHAYTPESPEVVQMVEAGIRYLRSDDVKLSRWSSEGTRILMAYAIFKYEHNPQDPVVQRGVFLAREMAAESRAEFKQRAHGVYETAVAALLLVEVGPEQYQAEARSLLDHLLSNQRAHGGLTYPTEQFGDISQTQYGTLAIWTLSKHGMRVDSNRLARLVDFLLRTQDPSGGWPYEATVAPSRQQLIRQSGRMNLSLAMGAGGSLLMAGELFGFWTLDDGNREGLEALPAAFKIAGKEEEFRRRVREAGATSEEIMAAINRLRPWLRNPTKNDRYYLYYRLYCEERYQSFLEVATGEKPEEPAWYNQGIEFLKANMADDGSWGSETPTANSDPPGIATSFAILFMIRSTQRAIGQMNEGIAQGGYGVPKDTTNIRLEGTQIKGAPVAGAVNELLVLMEEDGADELEGKSIPDDLQLAAAPEQRRKQLNRLTRLVRGSQSWQARRVAARLLGQSGELRVVPDLIYALSDPDVPTKRFARDGLRFISRRFDGFGMPDVPNEQEAREAQRAWRDWYRSLDPGYVFLDSDL